jgi:hypothetical protein
MLISKPSESVIIMQTPLPVFTIFSSSSRTSRTRSSIVVRAVYLVVLFSSAVFFLTAQQGQGVKLVVVQAFALSPICKATNTARRPTPRSSFLFLQQERRGPRLRQQSSSLQRCFLPLSSSFHKRRTWPFGYSPSSTSSSSSTVFLPFQRESLHQNQVGSRRTSRSLLGTTQLASSTGGGGPTRRGRPPKRSSSNDDELVGSGGAGPSAEDDAAWVDDVDIDILADGLEEDDGVLDVSSSSSSIMMGDAIKTSPKTAGANEDVDVIDDEYDEDDDALDELNIDDDDDDEEDDELEIEEEIVGELNDDDDSASDEWDDDTELEDGDEVDWDPDEDDAVYELEDDLDDPNYMKQKQIVLEAVQQSEMQEKEESFDALDFVMNEMTEQQSQLMDALPFIQDVEEQARELMLEVKDFDGMDIQEEMNKVSDLMDDDPYPRHEPGETNFLQMDAGLTDDDMEELDQTYKRIRSKVNEEPWDKVMLKDTMPGVWENLSQETIDEMEDCLQEIGGSAYNVTRWLLYDLDFNVTNLILSAIQHNPQAPIIFQHWYPQLVTYARYQHVRDVLDYDFTADHVEQADITELERYYAGFGYGQIPTKVNMLVSHFVVLFVMRLSFCDSF